MKRNWQKQLKNKWVKCLILTFVVLLLNSGIAITTGFNVIENIAKTFWSLVDELNSHVPNITFKSDDWIDTENQKDIVPGSWKIEKKAEWTSLNSARITFEVNSGAISSEANRDVIFVIDTSGSMKGDKINKVSENVIALSKYVFNEDRENKIAIITFSGSADIKTGTQDNYFSNNIDEITDVVNFIEASGGTNYADALRNVDKVLESYERKENHKLIILFLTDGYPAEESPKQVMEYKSLKAKYPFIEVSGVQYEMSNKNVIQDLKDISDEQYIAYQNNLKNILEEIILEPLKFDLLEITDFIDNSSNHFQLENLEDVQVSDGTIDVDLDTQKINWNLKRLSTGKKATMTIDVKFNDDLKAYDSKTWTTNKKETINLKLESRELNKTYTETPKLKNKLDVIYQSNAPEGCNVTTEVTKSYYPFDKVEITDEEPVCPGYQFKGWEVVEDDTTIINDKKFIMPSHHVIVGGKWTKVGIKKNFTGDVVKRGRLYDKVVEDYNSLENNTLADSNKFVKKIDFTNEPSIYYYYYGNPDVDTENNILIEDANHQNYVYYGGFCWKMIRTTENQGVKLLYYGTYEEGMCSIKLLGRTRFAKSGSLISESGYMYNRDYKDRKPRIFSEPSDLERGQGIYEKNDNIDINNSGAIYDETTYYYSDSVKYVNGEYVLQDPELKQWRDFKNDLKGFYTCASMIEKSCAKVHYIVGSGGIVTGSKVRYFYIELNNGQTLADVDIEMKLSKNATKNSDNTYTLNEPISNIKLSEFHKNDWKGYYICPDTTKSTCANMQYITYAKAGYPYVFINTSNVYKYANDVIYENGKYRLIDTAISPIKEVWNWEDEYLNLKKNKYTCFNDSGICDEVYYINHFTISENFGTQNTTYFTLNEGRKIEDILNEAIGFKEYDGGYYPRDTEIDINKLDSAIKIKVDEWYEQNIKGQEFENYLENPIFCNNRRLKDFYQQGFSPNVEGSSDLIYLDIAKDSLTCDHLNDRFTVNDESYKFTKSNSDIKNNGNGKLKYPIGLIDDYEIYLIGKGNTYYGANYWTLSPNNHDFHHGGSRIRSFKRSNHFDYFLSWENLEYRPVISLKYDAEYAGGTGAITNPYRIRGLFE